MLSCTAHFTRSIIPFHFYPGIAKTLYDRLEGKEKYLLNCGEVWHVSYTVDDGISLRLRLLVEGVEEYGVEERVVFRTIGASWLLLGNARLRRLSGMRNEVRERREIGE